MPLLVIQGAIDMLYAIFCKEYYKIRRFWLFLLLANILISLQMSVSTRRLFLLDHAEVTWYRVLQLGQLYCEQLRYLPVITGLILGVVQFLPEIIGERLRLGLHLPIRPERLICYHLVVGVIALLLALLPDIIVLGGITSYWFPSKWPLTLFFTVLPWFLAGIVAYLGCALVLLEPDVRLKGCNMLVVIGTCGWYLQKLRPGAYQNEVLFLFCPLLLMAVAVLCPVFHFRTRRDL